MTTVLSRLDDLLPRTLASLAAAGFDQPRLFVDGERDVSVYIDRFGLEVTNRYPLLRTFGNWWLALAELYVRTPLADRYAVFQDDFVTYRNLRLYLEACPYPVRGYWNLYTFPVNQALCPAGHTGWYPSNQLGKGAVALVFDRETVLTLLASRYMAERPQDLHRGHRSVDGGIVTALTQVGWREYVHSPSLVQHTGLHSSMGNDRCKGKHTPFPLAPSWRGEGFDALDLLRTRGEQS